MRRLIYYIAAVFVIAGLAGCASKRKNNATTRMYHAFTARYNTYYNGMFYGNINDQMNTFLFLRAKILQQFFLQKICA